LLRFVV
jgi:drug/metabolite transporter (DMT)-like permease